MAFPGSLFRSSTISPATALTSSNFDHLCKCPQGMRWGSLQS
jgi:hypothetical protein